MDQRPIPPTKMRLQQVFVWLASKKATRLQLILIGALLPLAVTLQWENKAYISDIGGHADEAAHVVTGLMLRDYVAGPLWRGESPVAFAGDYYARFPKIAIGHYPPLFYVFEGLWLLPIRNQAMTLLFCALVTSMTGALVIRAGVPILGWPASLAAGIAFCLYRPIQTYTAIVMSDLMVMGWCLAAVLAWDRFMRTERAAWSLTFGAFAAAAILTKGTGLLLALVPPFTLLLSRRLDLLRRRPLWWATIPVALLALPWMLATSHITREGMTGQTSLEFFWTAVPFYVQATPVFLGWTTTVALVLAIIGLVHQAVLRKPLSPSVSILWALLFSTYLLCCSVPAGLDERYLLPALPSCLLLGSLQIRSFARQFIQSQSLKIDSIACGCFCAAATLLLVAGKHDAPDKWISGPSALCTQAAALADSLDRPVRLLVSSDATGEGSVIAAAALRASEQVAVLRGSKVLASSDWMGRDYQPHFDSSQTLSELLEVNRVDLLIIDDGIRGEKLAPHQRLLNELLGNSEQTGCDLVSTVPTERREQIAEFRVFRVR